MLQPGTGRRGWLASSLLVGGAVTLGILLCIDPYAPDSVLPPCLFHVITGWFCPGCGSTRALHALLHGRLGTALEMNPLLVVSLPLLGLMSLNAEGWKVPVAWMPVWSHVRQPRTWLIAICAFWLLRNVPVGPFAWLAPG